MIGFCLRGGLVGWRCLLALQVNDVSFRESSQGAGLSSRAVRRQPGGQPELMVKTKVRSGIMREGVIAMDVSPTPGVPVPANR